MKTMMDILFFMKVEYAFPYSHTVTTNTCTDNKLLVSDKSVVLDSGLSA